MGKTTQFKIILRAMLVKKEKLTWTAKDFQTGEYFVGYEASARMSELKKMYPGLFIVGKQDRYRTLSINWDYENIKEIIDYVMN